MVSAVDRVVKAPKKSVTHAWKGPVPGGTPNFDYGNNYLAIVDPCELGLIETPPKINTDALCSGATFERAAGTGN